MAIRRLLGRTGTEISREKISRLGFCFFSNFFIFSILCSYNDWIEKGRPDYGPGEHDDFVPLSSSSPPPTTTNWSKGEDDGAEKGKKVS
jgi:hypothetical protein